MSTDSNTSSWERFLHHQLILLLLRLMIGVAFLYAGFLKIREPLAFADSIASFRLLPDMLINLLALGLPPLELIIGGLLVIGWRVKLASFAMLLLSVIFAIALGQALLRGLQVDCGCFGSGKPSTAKSFLSLGRDILLVAGSAWLYAAYSLQGGKSLCVERKEKSAVPSQNKK